VACPSRLGKADQSELYRRITLARRQRRSHAEQGRPVGQGANGFDSRLDQSRVAEWPAGVLIVSATKKAGAADDVSPTTPPLPDYKPTAAELKSIKELESLGVAIRPIAMNFGLAGSQFPRPERRDHRESTRTVEERPLSGRAQSGGRENQGRRPGEPQGLDQSQSVASGEHPCHRRRLVHLKGLVNLNYLNLYGTAVTDAGLEQLKGLTQLKHLYLWQTKTTDAGVGTSKVPAER